MKKILFTLLILIIPFLMMGCQKKTVLEDCLSEVTKIYFTAETENAIGNISVGEREENYIIDGVHTKNCDFSLIMIKFDHLLPVNQIEVSLNVNNSVSKVVLDLNPANHYYMTDLGYALNEKDKISLSFQDYSLNFINASQNFAIDYKEAIQLAKTALGDEINKFYKDKNFQGEVYLKVLTGKEQDQGQLFWVFTVVGKDGIKSNVVLRVQDGKIVISE